MVDRAEQHPDQQGDALAAVRFGQALRLVGATDAEHQLSVILHTSPRSLIPVVRVHALQSGQFPDVAQAEPPTRSRHRMLSEESLPAGPRNTPRDRTSTRAHRGSTGLPAAHRPCPSHRQRSRKSRSPSRIADEMDRGFSKTNQNAHCGAWLLVISQRPVPSQYSIRIRSRRLLVKTKI